MSLTYQNFAKERNQKGIDHLKVAQKDMAGLFIFLFDFIDSVTSP